MDRGPLKKKWSISHCILSSERSIHSSSVWHPCTYLPSYSTFGCLFMPMLLYASSLSTGLSISFLLYPSGRLMKLARLGLSSKKNLHIQLWPELFKQSGVQLLCSSLSLLQSWWSWRGYSSTMKVWYETYNSSSSSLHSSLNLMLLLPWALVAMFPECSLSRPSDLGTILSGLAPLLFAVYLWELTVLFEVNMAEPAVHLEHHA